MARRNKRYTAEQLAWLEAEYKRLRVPALTEAFNIRFNEDKAPGSIKACLANHKITCGRPRGMAKGECLRVMTIDQAAWVERHYVDISVRNITEQFNREFGKDLTVDQMKTFIANQGYKSGRTGRFYKGMERISGSGTKGPNSGSFKPGPRPHLRKAMGHERVDKDGYIWIRVDQVNPHTGQAWRYLMKHRVVWEAANGPIPKNMIVTFKDDNRQNCAIDNLELISRAENCRRNKLQYMDAPEEVRPSIKALAKLITDTSERARQ